MPSYKKDNYLLLAVTLIGFIASAYTVKPLHGYSYNFGKSLLGVFIPPCLTTIYSTYISISINLRYSHLVKIIVSYCVQIIPFAPLFYQLFQPIGGDDFSRYYLYADNMIRNQTLWGGDKLFFSEAGYHYVTQPGYRYIVYLELLIFEKLYRLTQFVNIGLYITVVFFFQKSIKFIISDKCTASKLLLLVLLFTPYAIKNLLIGLPEWFTVILLMLYCYFFTHKKILLSIILLALVPFFRQNLLVVVLLLFSWQLLFIRRKGAAILIFLSVLLLPIYHNLYYAGQWQFFVDIFQLPFINYNRDQAISINFKLILTNILHYIGLDINENKVYFSLIAAIFLPHAVIISPSLYKTLTSGIKRVFLIVTILSAIVPVIFLGTAYYPRFEFVNVVVIMVAYLLLFASQMPSKYFLNKSS